MSGQPPENPYGQDPSPQDPYGQNPYGQDPYGQQAGAGTPPPPTYDPHGRPISDSYGQQPYGAPQQYAAPQYGQQGWGPVTPKHASATTSMVLGLVGLIGGFVICGLPLLLSPFAWATGSRAVKEIDASGGQLSGRDQAMVGKVTGIIGTVLLILGLLAVIAFIALFAFTGVSTVDSGSTTFDDF